MKTKLIAVVLTSIFALTACGGSSDNGSNQPIDNQNNTTSEDKPFQLKNQVVAWNTKKGTKGITVDLPTVNFPQANSDGENFDQITVAGKKIKIGDSNNLQEIRYDKNDSDGFTVIYDGTFNEDADGNYGFYSVASNDNQKRSTAYAHYGWIIDGNSKDNRHEMKMFYQGLPTESSDMPSSGKAKYLGNAFAMHTVENYVATVGSSASHSDEKGMWYGKVELDVNFDEKTITGTLGNWTEGRLNSKDRTPLNDIHVEAKIQGNTFKTVNDPSEMPMPGSESVSIEGKFYGANAQNLAGSFIRSDSLPPEFSQSVRGVFGANKQ